MRHSLLASLPSKSKFGVMKDSLSGLLLLEALICGIPATFLAVMYLPWAAIVALGEFRSAPGFAGANGALLVAGLFALSHYWWLAIATCTGRRYQFGVGYYAAACCALAVAAVLVVMLPPMSVVAFLAAAAVIHFTKLQRKQALRSSVHAVVREPQ